MSWLSPSATNVRDMGLTLKRAMMQHAKTAGAVAISSRVDRRNEAMIELNRRVGATIVEDPDDPETFICVVRLMGD
jgi:hypothetical protein